MMINAMGVACMLFPTVCHHLRTAGRRLKPRYHAVRFGKITEKVQSVDGGVASEIEYRGRNGKVIGYWAYGYFDPALPYRG